MKDQGDGFAVGVVIGVLLLGLLRRRDQRLAHRRHPRARHRRHPRDVVRVGRRDAARPQFAGRRCRGLGQGPGQRARSAATGSRGRSSCWWSSSGRLDPAPPVDPRPVALRDRQQPAGRVPQRRRGRPDEDHRLRPDRPVLRRSAAGLTASTGSGSPVPGPYTLQSVAAIVLGGVSLAGGRGGIVGPILAVFILAAGPDRPDLPRGRPPTSRRRPGRDPHRRRPARQRR